MFVLKTIAVLVLLVLLYKGITTLNNKVYAKFKYDFFDQSLFILAFGSNLLLYFGHSWYLESLKTGIGILNGQVLMGIGAFGLLLLVALNIQKTNLLIGLIGSLIQIFLFMIASFFTVFILMAAALWLSETKPVYVINND